MVTAYPTRLLTTTSARMRGDMPYAVAFRRNVGLKSSSASTAMSRSDHTFDSPYGVTGLNAACSSSISPPDDAP